MKTEPQHNKIRGVQIWHFCLQFTDKPVEGRLILGVFLPVLLPNSELQSRRKLREMERELKTTVTSGAWHRVGKHDLFIGGIKLNLK